MRTPHGRLGDLLFTPSVALGRVIRSQVIDHHVGFECGHPKLVHEDVFSIELQVAHPVADVGVPAQLHGTQIKHLDVPIVIPSADTPLGVVVRVPESDRPAVSGGVPLHGLQRQHRVLLAGVPYPHASIPTPRHQLRSPTPHVQPATPVNSIHDHLVPLHTPNGLPHILQVPQLHVPAVVPGGQPSLLDARRPEGRALEPAGLLHLVHGVDLPLVQLADADHPGGPGHLPEQGEAGGLGDPPGLEGGEVEAVGDMLNDLGG
mmetsp:Transcript_23060/g.56000  ORF Transcript_23060/g.56000 Transcript_23060/m.56000 type:complete len:261 (+) Transcript_23060:422-1204(+)